MSQIKNFGWLMKITGTGTLKRGAFILGQVTYSIEFGSDCHATGGRGGLNGKPLVLWEAAEQPDLCIQLDNGDVMPVTIQGYRPTKQWAEIAVSASPALH